MLLRLRLCLHVKSQSAAKILSTSSVLQIAATMARLLSPSRTEAANFALVVVRKPQIRKTGARVSAPSVKALKAGICQLCLCIRVSDDRQRLTTNKLCKARPRGFCVAGSGRTINLALACASTFVTEGDSASLLCNDFHVKAADGKKSNSNRDVEYCL